MAQSILTELRGLFGVQYNVCDGDCLFVCLFVCFFANIVKGFYALTIFAERLRRGCLTGL